MRESAVRGQAIDLGDFERRLRGDATADREYTSPIKRSSHGARAIDAGARERIL